MYTFSKNEPTVNTLHSRAPVWSGCHASIAEEVYPDTILRGTSGSTTGKLTTTTTEVLQGTPFSRFPGTDANDDDHVLSLFNNRKGNASSVDDKVGDF